MLVYLLRHGRAVDIGAENVRTDEQRYLTDDGIRRLTANLRAIAPRVTKPDRILHSPYVRARQTAEILAATLGWDGELETMSQLVPGTSPDVILPSLQAAFAAGLDAIALVGHEPTMGWLLATLLTGNSNRSVPMATGMLAAVELKWTSSPLGRLLFAHGS